MPHDFNRFPELTNNQMRFYYWESPHQQITQDFEAHVVKVTDGDTIRVTCDFRDFEFPIRFAYINAPEMSEGAKESKNWLENQILNTDVHIKVNPKNRVGKWGRIIGEVFHEGENMSQASLREQQSVPFGQEILQ